MHPIIEASKLLSNGHILRKAAVHAKDTTIFLWELSSGGTIEVVRIKSGFQSTDLRQQPLDERLDFYRRTREASLTGDVARPA